jgi:cytochrome c oxidase subunit 2
VVGAFPALDASKIVMGPKADNIQILLKGKAGTAMQSYAAQLNDVEIAAVITYTRASWTNAGKGQDPVVAPADIKAAR